MGAFCAYEVHIEGKEAFFLLATKGSNPCVIHTHTGPG